MGVVGRAEAVDGRLLRGRALARAIDREHAAHAKRNDPVRVACLDLEHEITTPVQRRQSRRVPFKLGKSTTYPGVVIVGARSTQTRKVAMARTPPI